MKDLSRVACILATWAMVAVSSAAQIAPSQAPATEADCTEVVYGMIDCMGFLMVGGTETTPQGSCCSGLKTLVEFNADCVCFALDLAPTLGLDLDINRARALPSHCGLAPPSFHTCNISEYGGGESPSPAADPPAPAAAIGKPPTAALSTASAPQAAFVAANAPAPAPSSSSSVALPAIFSEFLFIVVCVLFLLN